MFADSGHRIVAGTTVFLLWSALETKLSQSHRGFPQRFLAVSTQDSRKPAKGTAEVQDAHSPQRPTRSFKSLSRFLPTSGGDASQSASSFRSMVALATREEAASTGYWSAAHLVVGLQERTLHHRQIDRLLCIIQASRYTVCVSTGTCR